MTISTPTKAKITTAIPVRIEPTPCGAKPPPAVRLEKSSASPEPRPSTYAVATPMNTTMAITLIEANQNSNSP